MVSRSRPGPLRRRTRKPEAAGTAMDDRAMCYIRTIRVLRDRNSIPYVLPIELRRDALPIKDF